MADSVIGRERVLPLLMGRAAPRVIIERWERGMGLTDVHGLNWSQAEAFANAYAANLGYLIQGPPGTGKTRGPARPRPIGPPWRGGWSSSPMPATAT